MTRPMDSLKLFATLLLFWILLNGSVAPGTVLVGLAVAAVIALAFRDTMSVLSGHKLTPQALIATVFYVGFFLKELVKANLQMAAIVLNPR
ncbi:MAG: Na+/H+ antiporter subunit E, partial [Maritimibacter sp.]|nr:Na+/H+ antiporter subunit E [Maritimibacter sp.]